ncbi:polysaccharide pyruvyl transferase family protein [Pseudorhodoferax aquiterrae]|uniref:polysaccharide pyruvyl transferase family protein n=1 Tax=Pseudorhodoferax aquiterrae TaxID=747304 RepID=UPI001678CE21|nr:polysaccharide pyruvyl transferase family protein [Pseudorhodoferax aquiterrae]
MKTLQQRVRNLFRREPPQQPAPDHAEVEVFSWSPSSGHRNFGDHLARVLVTKILADHGHVIEESVPAPRRLLTIGSVVHFGRTGDVVWGSGVNGKATDDTHHRYADLDVRAVRGPLTREFLMQRGIDVPEIYGDPALLLPHVFPGRFRADPRKRYAVVPNLHDLKKLQEEKVQHLVSPLDSWNNCVKQILQAELVISSSLHGIVIAEAYGIPARYVRYTETEKPFKYNDYMMGTGRAEMEAAKSIEEALEMGGMAGPRFDPKPLLDAFPIDIWRGRGEDA